MSVVDCLRALADESRIRLIKVLARGFFNVQELTFVLDLSQSTVSHHLKTLVSCDLVSSRREGTWSYYSLPAQLSESNDLPIGLQLCGRLSRLTPAESDSKQIGAELARLMAEDEERLREILDRRRETAHRYFESVADRWKSMNQQMPVGGTDQAAYYSRLLELIRPEAALVELGCGSGALLERVLPRSGKTMAVDYSQAMLDAAHRNLGKQAEAVDFRLGYLEHLPIGDQSVDQAVATMVFHHLSNPVEALRDVSRVLKAGGELLVLDLVPHTHEFMRERFADLWLGFEPQEFSDWCSDVGLKPVAVEILGARREAFLLRAQRQ